MATAKGIRAGAAFVEVMLDTSKIPAQMAKAVGDAVDGVGKRMESVGKRMSAAGAALAASFLPAIKLASDRQESQEFANTVWDLVDAFKDLQAAIGNALLVPLTKLARAMTTALELVTEWVEKNPELVQGFASFAVALTATGAAFVVLGKGMRGAVKGLAIILPLLANFPALVGIITAALYSMSDKGQQFFADMASGWGEMFDAMLAAVESGELEKAFDVLIMNLYVKWLTFTSEATRLWENFITNINSLVGLPEPEDWFLKSEQRIIKFTMKYKALLNQIEEMQGRTLKDRTTKTANVRARRFAGGSSASTTVGRAVAGLGSTNIVTILQKQLKTQEDNTKSNMETKDLAEKDLALMTQLLEGSV